jgi:hypothetical protein
MSQVAANTERVAVKLLQHRLDLANELLRNARESREAVSREQEIIRAAREAYEHSMEALNRLPQLSTNDREGVEKSMHVLRSALRGVRHRSGS